MTRSVSASHRAPSNENASATFVPRRVSIVRRNARLARCTRVLTVSGRNGGELHFRDRDNETAMSRP